MAYDGEMRELWLMMAYDLTIEVDEVDRESSLIFDAFVI